MIDSEISDQELEAQVSSEMAEAQHIVQKFPLDDIENGEWFAKLLSRVVSAYQRNARVEYFHQKYPGLSDDEIADKLISVTVRYAAIAGGLGGAAASASQIASLITAGTTAAIFLSSIGIEMICLANIQIRLILDLSTVYDLQLDPNDPEDILMVFGYALGIAPTDLVGKGLRIAAEATTKSAVKRYISKGTLKAVQDFTRMLGFKILQRTIIKYAVPGISAVVGGGYNYLSTLSVGKVAKSHFKNRGKVTEELRKLVSKQVTSDILFPAATLYMAHIDGEYHEREQELYKAILSRMSFAEHTKQQFQQVAQNENDLLEIIAEIDDPVQAQMLLDLLVLMATYDGKLAETEGTFLLKVADTLQLPIDISTVREKASEYQFNPAVGRWQRFVKQASGTLQSVGSSLNKAGTSIAQSVEEVGKKPGRFKHKSSKSMSE